MDGNNEIKLCLLLIISILRKYSSLTYMHNLKTNFDKILDIAKSTLSDVLLPEDNFEPYRNKPKMTNIEVVALAIAAESIGH